MEQKVDFEVIIPVSMADVDMAKKCIVAVQQYINPLQITVITSEKACSEFNGYNINVLDENKVLKGLNLETVREYLEQFGLGQRAGWYFQQFLKYAYAYICQYEYYVSWDADTLPLTKMDFFNGITPVFSIKTEYHEAYFNTLNKLLKINKQIENSFIAEHMIFKKEYVLELISEISCQHPEVSWYISILKSIAPKDIMPAGFSEFETYGSYVMYKHKGSYILKDIAAIRIGKCIFDQQLSEDIIRWLGQSFCTISFEKGQQRMIKFSWYKNSFFRKIIPAKLYVKIASKYVFYKWGHQKPADQKQNAGRTV